MENKRKTIFLVGVSIVLILVVGAFFVLWIPEPPRPAPMPVPNGYAAFVQAGGLVQKQTGDFSKMDPASLLSLVEANSNALQIARAGLAEKSRVPLGYSMQYASDHITDLSQLKMLAFAFAAEGRQAELDKRTNDAAQAYLDTIRLGINSRQGGTLIDGLVGIAIEAMGTFPLQKLATNLDAKASADLARQLEAVDSSKESWEQTLQNEKSWMRQTFPLQYRIAELFTSSGTKASRRQEQQRFDAQENKTRRLKLGLAARAYELEKGHQPTNVAELVPAYLKAAPIDPLTGKEMTLTP